MLRHHTIVALANTCHLTPVLPSLHWLKIKKCIEYKLLSLPRNVRNDPDVAAAWTWNGKITVLTNSGNKQIVKPFQSLH